jgi:hypothetical protein
MADGQSSWIGPETRSDSRVQNRDRAAIINNMANNEALKLYAWKPGQSGNPRGRLRGSKLRSRARDGSP